MPIRAILRQPDGTLRTGGPEIASPARFVEGSVMWLDVSDQKPADLEWLGERFGFHPLTLEDCAHLDQRPKTEEYEGYVFVVFHAFTASEADCTDVAYHEMHAFLSQNYLVTVHQDTVPAFEEPFKKAGTDNSVLARGPDFALYTLMDSAVDAHFPLLDRISDEIESLEEHILSGTRKGHEDLKSVFRLKSALVLMRKVLSPQRAVLNTLARHEHRLVTERDALYYRDVYDHLTRISEAIDADRDLLGNVMEAYLSISANRTNEVMKRLTVVSVVFMPLAAVTGFFGMNFTDLMPFHSAPLFGLTVASVVLVPTTMLVWFRQQGWW
jgi:magnesium transporter